MKAARALIAAALIAAAASSLWAAPPPASTIATANPPASIIHVTQPGDTLIGFADRALKRPADWHKVARINRVTDPHRLPIGKPLVIPTSLLRREPLTASIAAWSGQVRIDPATPLKLGAPVGAGATISTGANSFITLLLADGSRVTLPSQSVVHVETMDRIVLDGRIDRSFRIESGRADFGVTPRAKPDDRFMVRTPVAVAAVRGTEFRVAHDAGAGKSAVSVIEGDVAGRALAAPGETGIAAGNGAVLGKGPVQLAKLLPPPVLERPGRVQDDPEVIFRTANATGARRHVQLARDAGFVELFAESETTDDGIGFADVANGTIYVRVTAIDADGVEGLPATYQVERFQSGLSAEAGAPPGKPRRSIFRWQAVGAGTRRYDFVLARDADLVDRIVDAPGLADSEITVTNLPYGNWFWRVTMVISDGGKTYTRVLPVRKLTIARPER